MLEVTIVGFHGDNRELKTFQFENDALQTYLTECSANGHDCQITSLRALGVPLTVTGDAPKQQRGKTAKEAAYGAEVAESDNPRARVNQPIQRTRQASQPIDESQPAARTTDMARQPQPSVKPTTERK